MVAGSPTKSHNANSSSNHHFVPTRPHKQQNHQGLKLPDFHQQSSKRSKNSFVLRPKNVSSGKVSTSVITPKAKSVETPSQNGAKRPTTMTGCPKIDNSTSPSDRVVINEAKRRYVLRPQIGYSVNSINMMLTSHHTADDGYNHYSPDEKVVSGILDGITSLCLGPTSYPQHVSPARACHSNSSSNTRRPSSPQQQRRRKKKVLYPIASYPARLNCQKLVSERRAIFQQNLFRPVSSDEMSQYQSSVRTS